MLSVKEMRVQKITVAVFMCLALQFLGCDWKDSGQPAASTETPETPETIPEPASWSFPEVIESARAISPRNIEGKNFNESGLVYSTETLESLPIATMQPMELQKYADIVTHAYPDAVFKQVPGSCNEIPLEETNETFVAGLAYISLHAVDPATREKAAACLKDVQTRWDTNHE